MELAGPGTPHWPADCTLKRCPFRGPRVNCGNSWHRGESMIGWPILFALFAVTGGALTLTGFQSAALLTANALFVLLSFCFVLARLIRDQAR